ncbi:M48 family metalloprotease [soil metagenome]
MMPVRTLLMISGIAACGMLLGCSGVNLPGGIDLGDLGRSALRVGASALPIGADTEREIGFGIAATVAGRYPVLDDPEVTRYVNLVGQTVAQQTPRWGEVDFHFAVLDTDEVNAFAAPGGFIFVTRGAIDLMESEAELAAVLAHEIAHVDQRHVLTEIRRAAVLRTARDETQISGALLNQIADFGSGVLFTGLSREDELQSDSLAVLYASEAGYRGDGLLEFLGHLEHHADHGPAGRLRELQATHPTPADRSVAVRRQLERLGTNEGRTLADRFTERVGGGR